MLRVLIVHRSSKLLNKRRFDCGYKDKEIYYEMLGVPLLNVNNLPDIKVKFISSKSSDRVKLNIARLFKPHIIISKLLDNVQYDPPPALRLSSYNDKYFYCNREIYTYTVEDLAVICNILPYDDKYEFTSDIIGKYFISDENSGIAERVVITVSTKYHNLELSTLKEDQIEIKFVDENSNYESKVGFVYQNIYFDMINIRYRNSVCDYVLQFDVKDKLIPVIYNHFIKRLYIPGICGVFINNYINTIS